MAIPHAPKPRTPKPARKPAKPKADTSLATINKTDPRKLTSAQKSRVAQLIANAATRHLLDARFLNPAQRASRELNTQLNTPVVEGSSVTNREMAQQRRVAEGLRFGPQEAQINQEIATRQQMARDTGSFYDQYLAELRQHQANTQQINAQGVAQQQALTGAVGAIQAPPAAPVVPGATQDPSVAQDAQNATALRQALAGSFGAQFAAQGAARDQYANTLAHVVAPTQKLSAQAQAAGNVQLARQALIQEAAEKGLFGQQFEDRFREQESRNVSEAQKQKLAADIAGIKLEQADRGLSIQEQNAETARQLGLGNLGVAQANAQTQRANSRTAARALGVNAAAKQANTPEAREAAKYGRSLHDWRLLGPKGRQQVKEAQAKRDARNYRRAHPTAKKGPDVILSGAFAGRTKQQVARMPESEKKRLINEYNKVTHPGRQSGAGDGNPRTTEPSTQYRRDFRSKYGVDPVPTATVNRAKSDIGRAGTWLGRIVSEDTGLNEAGRILSVGQPKAGRDSVAVPKMDPLFVRVAMDLRQYHGYITPGTADRLHRAGYSTAQLGLKTRRPPRPVRGRGGGAGAAAGGALGARA